MTIKETGEAFPTVFFEKKTEHSKKPNFIRNLINEKTCGQKIELFARQKYEGWHSWGNEIDTM